LSWKQYVDKVLMQLLACMTLNEVQDVLDSVVEVFDKQDYRSSIITSFWNDLGEAYSIALKKKIEYATPKGVLKEDRLDGIFKESTSAKHLFALMRKTEERIAQAKKNSSK